MSQKEVIELTAGEMSLLQHSCVHLLAKRIYRWMYRNTPNGPDNPPPLDAVKAHLEETEAGLLKICRYFLLLTAVDHRNMHVEDHIVMFYNKCIDKMKWDIESATRVPRAVQAGPIAPGEDPF